MAPGFYLDDAAPGDEDSAVWNRRLRERQDEACAEELVFVEGLSSGAGLVPGDSGFLGVQLQLQASASCRERLLREATLCLRALYLFCRFLICCSIFLVTKSMAV